jgi:hypothetical protein
MADTPNHKGGTQHMNAKKQPKTKMYAIEPDSIKEISDYISKAKKKTGLSIRRIVTEIIRDAVIANRFSL